MFLSAMVGGVLYAYRVQFCCIFQREINQMQVCICNENAKIVEVLTLRHHGPCRIGHQFGRTAGIFALGLNSFGDCEIYSEKLDGDVEMQVCRVLLGPAGATFWASPAALRANSLRCLEPMDFNYLMLDCAMFFFMILSLDCLIS